MSVGTLTWRSDNVIEIPELKNEVSNQIIVDATVTVILLDSGRHYVDGVNFPITMNHVGLGKYRAVFPNEIELNRKQKYNAYVTADYNSEGTVLHREWCIEYTVICG